MMRAHTNATPIRSVLTAAALLTIVLGACGGDDAGGVGDGDQDPVRACSPEPPDSSEWTGPGRFELGEADVDAFNRFLAEAVPPVSTSPCDAARVFDHLDVEPADPGETVDLVVEPEDSPEATVTITRSNFADDSVFGSRWVLEFEPADGDRIRLVRAIASQRCQPGRGQQDFGTDLCI